MTYFMPDKNVLEKNTESAAQPDESGIPEVLKPLLSRCLALSHTISNPLAGILGFCELLLLEDEPLSEEQRDMIEQMLDCAERIRAQIDLVGDEKMVLSRKLSMDKLIRQAGPLSEN